MNLRARRQVFGRWVSNRGSTLRLAASYLLVIMVMSLSFSYIFYHTSEGELSRQLPPDRLFSQELPSEGLTPYHEFFRERIEEGRSHLLNRLILVNLLTLVLGAGLSYFLARHNLEPIERAMDAQARFAADASHELRTPLTTLQAENEVALRNPKLTLANAKQLLRSNLEEVIRLRDLAESLLRLSRGQEKGLTIEPVSMSSVASEAIDSFLKVAKQKHIALDNQVPAITALADSASLLHIIKILLDNAIKYSDEHTRITLEAHDDNNNAYLSVRDEGVGISARDMPHIFERFYRADTSRSKRHVEGNGLGLALASTLIKQLHGDITASSTPGQGTTLTIRLPRARLRKSLQTPSSPSS